MQPTTERFRDRRAVSRGPLVPQYLGNSPMSPAARYRTMSA